MTGRPIVFSPLEVGWITLRSPRSPDVAWIHDACQDPEIQRWTEVPVPYRAEHAVGFLRLATDGLVAGSAVHLVIEATETGELLGAIGLKDVDRAGRSAEAGYWLARDGRGQGVATAALDALTRWAFDGLGLTEVRLEIAAGNAPSLAVAHRAGFRPRGTVTGGCRDGAVRVDSVLFVRRAAGNAAMGLAARDSLADG